jgi:hypothetical protein
MRELFLLAIHLLVTVAKLCRPGGVRAVVTESLLLKQQLLVSNRSRHRAPNLTSFDRVVLGLATLFVKRGRIEKVAALLSPATLFKFHKALIKRKYSLLFSSSASGRKPGPKGPRRNSSRQSSRPLSHPRSGVTANSPPTRRQARSRPISGIIPTSLILTP